MSILTFTRAIARVRPPRDPAGIGHTPEDARRRWRADEFRYPPYTYKLEYCLSDSCNLRVRGAAEREVLMGFLPGHTLAKCKGVLPSHDVRCAAVGNSFHTGVVASVLRCCLRPLIPTHIFPSQEELAVNFYNELTKSQAEVCAWSGEKPSLEDTVTWLDRLEQQTEAVPVSLAPGELQLVLRILSRCSYRGTDVHLDTLYVLSPRPIASSISGC